jgi:hypothetical protein
VFTVVFWEFFTAKSKKPKKDTSSAASSFFLYRKLKVRPRRRGKKSKCVYAGKPGRGVTPE